MADMLEEVLVAAGYEVCGIARTVNEGVELCERHKPDLAVMDIPKWFSHHDPMRVPFLMAEGRSEFDFRRGIQAMKTHLIFTDDGIGFPEPRSDKRHGVGLVTRLWNRSVARRQFVPIDGTEWTLKFPTSRNSKASDDTRVGSAR